MYLIYVICICIIVYVIWLYISKDSDKADVTSSKVKRLIYFRGHTDQENSAMITQVMKNRETISSLSSDLECATRTLLNLYNLHAVRGNIVKGKLDINTAMVGPLCYYGYLNPYDSHTIKIEGGHPTYFRHTGEPQTNVKRLNPDSYIYSLHDYDWIRGIDLKQKYTSFYDNEPYVDVDDTLTKDSLFNNPGILYTNKKRIKLSPIRNPQDYDLSSFKVNLVKND